MQLKNPEDFHNKLGFVFHALLALPLAAFVYLFLETRNRGLEPAMANGTNNHVIIALLVVMAFAGVAFGYHLFRKKNQEIREIDGLPEKLRAYYKNALIFYAFIEAGSIVMIVGLYLTTSTVFIVGYMFLLLVLSLNRPTPQKYVKDLGLGPVDRDIILHKKPFEESK